MSQSSQRARFARSRADAAIRRFGGDIAKAVADHQRQIDNCTDANFLPLLEATLHVLRMRDAVSSTLRDTQR